MKINCNKCQSQFNIPDDKIPPGKSASLTCPKCKQKIKINAPAPKQQDPMESVELETMDAMSFFEEDDLEAYDASDKPFDFVEEEGKTALVCEEDPEVREQIITVLDVLEYHITTPKNNREALKKMRYQNYDVIVVNEGFDSKNPDANGVLIYLERLDISNRRNMFVTLVSNRFRTMDQMAAFQKSVNIVVNMSNIHDFDKIFRRGIADYDIFYRVYREVMT